MATPTADSDSLSTDDQQYISTFFCKALYDYQSQDDSSLSFRKGDVIEVLTKLETGWWDGLLGDERGWFPSNYVAVISDEEADAVLSAAEDGGPVTQDGRQPHAAYADASTLDNNSETMSSLPSMSSLTSSSSSMPRSLQSDDWADGEVEFEPPRRRAELPGRAPASTPSQPSDFWVPTMSPDGQIYYVNTQTGQHSRDLPMETEEELSEGDYSGLSAQQRGRSGSTTVFGRANGASGRSNGTGNTMPAGFGIPKRSGTPEPWVRRLADDGLSYYYLNKLDGSMQWTMPEPAPSQATIPPSSRANGIQHGAGHPSSPARQTDAQRTDSRLRAGSSASNALRGRSDSTAGYTSAYSDDSDVDPLDRQPSAYTSNNVHSLNGTRQAPVTQLSRAPLEAVSELTSAERLAQALQQNLAPAPPESVTDISGIARQSVVAVIDYIQAHGVSNQPLQQRELSNRILDAVASIRNLLCISSPAYGHISSSLYPKDGIDPRANAFAQAIQAQLKPAQRKVTATLSKLVLAELAANYDASGFTSDAPSRMVADAMDLDRAIVTFVLEVQRSNSQTAVQPARTRPTAKRLRAALSPSNIGLGLIGAGAAGSWKGFGWVALENAKEVPPRVLAPDAITELKSIVDRVNEKLRTFAQSLAGTVPVDQIYAIGRATITLLHSALTFVASVHVARAVDIDGINREGAASHEDIYLQSVQKARVLVRTLEAAVQALYDDGATLFLSIQTSTGSWHKTADALECLIHPIQANLGIVQHTMEALLHIGQDQSDMAQNDYRGSIEWRMSRISMIDSNLGRTLREISGFEENTYLEESEDVVDMAHALSKPAAMKPASSQDSSTLYATDGSSVPESSTEGSHRRGDSAATQSTWRRPGHKPSDSIDSLAASTEMGGDDFLDDDDDLGPAAGPSKVPSSKVFKLLGEEPTHLVNTIVAERQPWYLRPNYGNDIQIDPDGKVRAGTVQALVERLTAHENSDTTFSKTFLLTYKSFTDIDTLFDLLQQRFWIKPPDNLTSAELEDWTKLKQHVIRTRVLNTLKTIVTDDDILEKDDMHILDRMKEMLQNEEVMRSTAAKQLVVLIERAQKGDNSRPKTTISLDPQPPPIIPKLSKKTKLTDFDPLEIARQLTMIECHLYQKIKPSECLLRSREAKGDSNDNIAAIIETTNKIAHWVADTVLSKQDSRKRAVMVKHFINVADRCRNLHNFSSMIAIVSGLNSPPIRRLKRTWEQINQRSMTLLGACEMTIDSNKNFSNYRQLLARITPPCVPFIGTYLTTLTFIQDGAPNNVGNLVNFRKRQKSAETIDEIKKWQSKPFNFAKVEVIHEYIQECLNKFNAIPDVSDLFWNLSLEREPREREDEKMARLLQETGFL